MAEAPSVHADLVDRSLRAFARAYPAEPLERVVARNGR
jgi:hypothetical protein